MREQPHHLLTTRLHRRLLGLTPPLDLSGERTDVPLRTLVCHHEDRALLRRHLATAGQCRGGLLLGTRAGETLFLTHVLSAGYAWWLPEGDPFAVDARYVLGAVDALRNDSETHLDWIGNWVMYADGRVGSEEADRALWEEAYRRALVSEDAVLMVLGLNERRLEVRGYRVAQGQPETLEVEWVGDSAGEDDAGG